MSVKYKLYQNNNENFVNRGKWYARAHAVGTVRTADLAETMQRNCTLKKSDIQACITELVETMALELQAGNRVKLDGFGSFKIGISSAPAESPKKFSVATHIKGIHVIFQPEVKVSADHKRTRTFLTGATVEEFGVYQKPE